MRVFKATYRDREGKKRESSKWYVEMSDHLQRRRRLPGLTWKKATTELGRKLGELVECRLCGERPGAELRKWLETLSASMTKKLCRWGILDGKHAAASKPLEEHAEDYRTALQGKGDSPEHVATTSSMVLRVLEECRFRSWSDISASRLEAFLADMRKQGASVRTSNAYLVAFKGFCKWSVRDGRVSESPVEHLQSLNGKADIRRKRRALTADECRKLIQKADPDRAMLYRLALETGLRANELRNLTVSSFDFDGLPPTVTVSAESSKHRREDVLPLRQDMAGALRQYVAYKLPAAMALNVPRRTAEALRDDLEAAGIPYADTGDGVVDFHSPDSMPLKHIQPRRNILR